MGRFLVTKCVLISYDGRRQPIEVTGIHQGSKIVFIDNLICDINNKVTTKDVFVNADCKFQTI